MAVDYDSIKLSNTIGQNIQTTGNMNQTVFESENVSGLNIVGLSTISLTSSLFVRSNVYTDYGFILDHPVYGNLDWNPNTKVVIPIHSDTNTSSDFGSYTGTNNNVTFASASIGGSTGVFNRSSSYIIFPTFPTITEPYSVNIWLLATSVVAGQQSLIDLSGPVNTYPLFDLRNTGKFLLYAGAEKYKYSSFTLASSDYNTWIMASFTVASNTVAGMNIYVNGSLSNGNGGGDTGTYYSPANTDIQIGRSNISNYFGGNICEVSIYNRVLTAAEIQALYNSGVPKRYPQQGFYGYALDGGYLSSSNLLYSTIG